MLLGDIGQVEELRKRPRDWQGFVHRHLLEDAGQRREVRVAPAARLLRQGTDPLHGVVGGLALLAAQGLAQQLAKQSHIVPQRLGQFVSHVDES